MTKREEKMFSVRLNADALCCPDNKLELPLRPSLIHIARARLIIEKKGDLLLIELKGIKENYD